MAAVPAPESSPDQDASLEPPRRLHAGTIQHICIGETERFAVDHGALVDISIAPSEVPDLAVSAFGATPVTRNDVISVKGGARCNCYCIDGFAPHLHGTHLETRDHLLVEPQPAITRLKGMVFVARLITAAPQSARGLGLSLVPDENDRVITAEQVREQLSTDVRTPELVIIRSPNTEGKQFRKYGGTNPPYPHHELAQLLVDAGVEHVILDFPSADREEGELLFHRTFWQDPVAERTGERIPELAHIPNAPRTHATITELAYIPDEVQDGWYAVYLAPIGFPGDAAPVRPLIAPILGL